MLEHTLGVVLLERTSRSVRLTHAGRTFLVEARRVLETAEAATRITRRVAHGEAGRLTVGFTSAAAFRALPLLVSHIHAALPELELVLKEMVTPDQVAALGARQLDLGLLRQPATLSGNDSRLAMVPLVRERLLLAMPHGHELASGRQPVLQDLDGQPFITWAPGGGSYFLSLLATLFHGSGVAPRTVQRVNQAHTMLALVRVGMGLALIPESARSLRIAGVTLRPIRLPGTVRSSSCPSLGGRTMTIRPCRGCAPWRTAFSVTERRDLHKAIEFDACRDFRQPSR